MDLGCHYCHEVLLRKIGLRRLVCTNYIATFEERLEKSCQDFQVALFQLSQSTTPSSSFLADFSLQDVYTHHSSVISRLHEALATINDFDEFECSDVNEAVNQIKEHLQDIPESLHCYL